MACSNCTNAHPEEAKKQIQEQTDAIIARIGTTRNCAIPLLQAIQETFNYLPSDAIERVYEKTEIDRAQLISVSTFYAQFRHMPIGKHLIKVCTGTACHVKGAEGVYEAFRRELGMKEDEVTSEDKEYTVEKVACLGCCPLAPVVQIDEKIYGPVLTGKVREVLEDFEHSLSTLQGDGGIVDLRQVSGEVRIGMGSCCIACGAQDIRDEIFRSARELGIEVRVKDVGCVSVCTKVPLIDVVLPDGTLTRYPNVKVAEVKEILNKHFKPKGFFKRLRNRLLDSVDTLHTDVSWNNVMYQSKDQRTGVIDKFLDSQTHIATDGYGLLAPLDLDEYMAHGGFESMDKVLSSMSREQVVKTVLDSGIRGRGGGGFPTGRKWSMVVENHGGDKYMICNGDEGDPGAFMDRMILESYPFRVIEGMIIAAYAAGANKGVFYIRAEYPLATKVMRRAIEICKEKGIIGENIHGSGFSFDVMLFEGAGAFVCGEETALIASIEGDRGFPRQRPPYPAVKGLFGCPTLVNNVETLSQIAYIIRNHQDYASIGTEKSKGTKVFALTGKVRNGGLIEVPMGISINHIVNDIGGGVEGGRKLKAVLTGGPSGGCIPAELCDVSVDYEALTGLGAMMGSGGMVVLSEDDCMVDIARYFLTFTCDQSCGKCTFCRVGIRRMLDILEKLCSGRGTMEDIDTLEHLANHVKRNALCGLGKSAPNPVLTTLRYFRNEYIDHVNGICRTGVCTKMVKYQVNDRCTGCTKCSRVCPAAAIPYTPYELHTVDVDKCVMCGLCLKECDYDAIDIVPIKEPSTIAAK